MCCLGDKRQPRLGGECVGCDHGGEAGTVLLLQQHGDHGHGTGPRGPAAGYGGQKWVRQDLELQQWSMSDNTEKWLWNGGTSPLHLFVSSSCEPLDVQWYLAVSGLCYAMALNILLFNFHLFFCFQFLFIISFVFHFYLLIPFILVRLRVSVVGSKASSLEAGIGGSHYTGTNRTILILITLYWY